MKKAWVVAVDMGYGHQRAAFTLRRIALKGKIITANDYPGIPELDRTLWRETRRVYEFISKFKKIPVLGDLVFSLMDKVQEIKPFYPKERPLEPPGLQLRTIYGLIERKEWGRHLIEKLDEHPLPMVCTFPVPAFMAEHWKYRGDIYLLVTDSDVARAWVPFFPKETKIHYLAPSQLVAERLLQYGISKKKITLTGFPLPEEFTSSEGFTQTKEDLRRRLVRLDQKRKYITRYADVVRSYLGKVPTGRNGAPVITFAVGGAGAQQALGQSMIHHLAPLLKKKKLKLQMVAATHKDAATRFKEAAAKEGLSKKEVQVVFLKSKDKYFKRFTEVLRATDILWTKPSELSFYAALGIPLLLAPPIGSQEVQNQKWLARLGVAIPQLKVEHADEWIPDFLNQGLFAEAAMQGFVEMERNGAKNIASVIESNSSLMKLRNP
ncbi:hypothetical protein IH982_03350 [Patescibacteria group bacterium]|nr:hypothetical protein [Patescibacteria group bacterium]